jgi:3alpha(or 20beta)-hydroxysteroid dehydrogenase
MTGRLADKVAVITGGARGQGAAEGALFAAEGAVVYLTDVRTEEGEKAAAAAGASFLEHDVTSPSRWREIVDQVVAQHGRLDVLVNNAGIFHAATMADTPLETWQRLVAINQTGVFLGMQTVAPQMKAQRSGSIINISSVAGIRGTSICFAYGATKWAVRGMTKSAAQELGPFGVRVNSIHPGIIDTPMLEGHPLDALTVNTPLARVAHADEVARLALWLASDENSYATGAEFVIDGGMTA